MLKRASTVVQETRLINSDYVQNKNYFLSGFEDQENAQVEDKEAAAKMRKIKFFVDNVLPRTADVVSVDAYGGNHAMIPHVIENLKWQMVMEWKMAID